MTGAPARTRPTDVDHLVATAVLTLSSVVTTIAMCRVFAGWEFLRPLLVVVVGVHATALLLRIGRVHGAIALPLMAIVLVQLLALTFYADTLRFGFPTGTTLDLVRTDLRLVWTQFPTAVAPVPSEGPFLLAAAIALGVAASFADAFAFRAFGRTEAVVPMGVVFVFTAALGTERLRIEMAAAWLASAIVVVAVLRALHGSSADAWLGRRRRAVSAALPATAMCAAAAAIAALAIAPRLPGAGAEPLLDTRQRSDDVTEVLNPLVDIRSRLVNRTNTEMFNVSSPVGRYWRVSALSEFDGTRWGLPDRPLRRTDDGLNIASPDARIVQQQIRIARFGGSLLPSTHAPVEVSRPEVIDWLPETDTLVLDDRVLRQGDVYTIGADVAVPSPDQLRATTASNPPASIFFELPGDVPDEAVDIARQLVAGQPTPYDAALALQNWFRTEFEYDLDVQAGHSDDAISNFLRVRRGYCEQFAGTFAVMARAVGLPARVAVGFTPGEQLPDGTYRVLGKHAHAWAEVWFDGFGWVLFEPTPGRGAPGSEAVTGVPAAQDDTPRETGGSAGEPVPTPTTVFATPTPTTERDPLARPTPVTTVAPTTVAGSGPTGGRNVLTVFVLLGLVCGWVFGMPALVRRWTRRGGDPAAQVVDAWHGAVGVLATAGASPPAGDTPIEYARRVPHDLAFDHRALDELARLVTRAVYAPAGVGEPAALRAGVLRTQVSSSVAEVMPWRRRVVARLDPFAQRRALVGDRRRDTPHRHERVPDRAAQPTAGGTERSDELVGAS